MKQPTTEQNTKALIERKTTDVRKIAILLSIVIFSILIVIAILPNAQAMGNLSAEEGSTIEQMTENSNKEEDAEEKSTETSVTTSSTTVSTTTTSTTETTSTTSTETTIEITPETTTETTEETETTETETEYCWEGEKLNSVNGRVTGPSGEETYYDMDMTGVIAIMKREGYDYEYKVRDDGVKTYGGYVMVAANLGLRPRGTLIPTSLGMGIVCDTGSFADYNQTQLDIAVAW